MPLSKEEIQKIAEASAHQVLEGLHRYPLAYEEPRDIERGLLDSMVEERTAASWYRQRAEHARRQGDNATAEIYEHIAKEKDEHREAFHGRWEETELGIVASWR